MWATLSLSLSHSLFSTMAAAAATVRPLLHRTVAFPSLSATVPKPNNHLFHLPSSQRHHLETQSLHIRTPLQTLFPLQSLSPFHHRLPSRHLFRAYAASAYAEDDDGEEPGGEYEPQLPSRPSSSPPGESRRLYVGNLPFSMTSGQLADLFSQAGTVDNVEIVYDRATDRSRGFAFITMGSFDEANEAIRMFDGSQVGGRTAKVNFPEVPRGGERAVVGPRIRREGRGFVSSPYKVYAGNLGWTVTSQSLREVFAARPGLLGARVVYDRDSGLSRGFGFVSFESPEDAQSAIDAINGQEVEGRPLRLSLAAGRPSAAPSQGSTADRSSEQFSEVDLSY